MKILLVDDNHDTLKLFRAILEHDGFEVETAYNGQEALERAKAAPPILVVSDILMPVMDGFALCRAWQDDPELRRIPFVFSSGVYKSFKDESDGLALGAAAFIRKPTDPPSLLAVVRYFLREKPAGGEAKADEGPRKPVALKPYNVDLVQSLERQTEELLRSQEALKESELRLRELYQGALAEIERNRGLERAIRPHLEAMTALVEALEKKAHGDAELFQTAHQLQEQVNRLTGLLEDFPAAGASAAPPTEKTPS